MKLLRTLIVPAIVAAALLAPVGAFAQQTNTAPAPAGASQQWQGHRGHRGGFMRRFRNLNLSAQQKTQIHALNQQFRQAHPKGSQRDPQARKQLRAQIMAVLTPQQQAQLKTQMQQMRARREAHEQQPQPGSTPQP